MLPSLRLARWVEADLDRPLVGAAVDVRYRLAPPAPRHHRHRRRLAVRRPLRPPLVPPGAGVARVPAPGHRQPAARDHRAGAPGPHPRPQRRGARRQPLSFVVSLDRQVLARARRRRAHRRARAPRGRARPPRRPRRPVTVERARAAPGCPTGSARTRRCRSPRTSPRSSPSTSPSTVTTSSASLHVESRAIRTYPYGRVAVARARLRRRHQRRGVRVARDQESPLRYQLTDEIGKAGVERTYEDDLRGQPGSPVLEVDAEGDTVQRAPEYPRRSPATTSSSPSTSHVQAVAEQALREELDRRAGTAGARRHRPNVAPAGSVVVLDPATARSSPWRRTPTSTRRTFTDGIDQAECDCCFSDPAQSQPAHQPGHPGPVRARLDVQAHHRLRRAHHRAASRRRRRGPTVASTASRTAPATAASSATPAAGPTARVDLRRGPHGVERHLLLRHRRPLLVRPRPVRRPASRTRAELFGLGADTRRAAARTRSRAG